MSPLAGDLEHFQDVDFRGNTGDTQDVSKITPGYFMVQKIVFGYPEIVETILIFDKLCLLYTKHINTVNTKSDNVCDGSFCV